MINGNKVSECDYLPSCIKLTINSLKLVGANVISAQCEKPEKGEKLRVDFQNPDYSFGFAIADIIVGDVTDGKS